MSQCCIPDCSDSQCGDDGCGGSCGVCGELLDCVEGQCQCTYETCGDSCCDNADAICFDGQCCTPQCDAVACGDDQCGGTCGVCDGPGAWICDGGECICQDLLCGDECCADPDAVCFDGACCVPQCDGKNCGDDACGGVCGTCVWPQPDCVEGTCVCIPQCDDKECGSDGCMGECGTCDPGETCVDFLCLSTVGPEIVANQLQAGNQMQPELVELDDGNVLLVWVSKPTAELVYEVRGRIISSEGVPIGDEFSVSGDLAVGNNTEPRLVQVPGGALVAWNSSKVHMAWLANDGSPVTPPVTLVDSDGTYRTYLPFYAGGKARLLYSADAPGPGDIDDFYLGTLDASLAWEADQPVLMDWIPELPASDLVLGAGGVMAVGFWDGTVATYTLDGAAVDAPVPVTQFMPAGLYDKPYPRLAHLAGGDYGVVYDLSTDDLAFEARAARLADPGLTVIDQDVVLNETSNGNQWMTRISPLAAGGYMAAWRADFIDGEQEGVAVRRVGADGVPVGEKAKTVPQYTSGNQFSPAVVALQDSGDVIVVWSSGAHPDSSEPFDISLRYLPASLFE